jgi:SulP family sulfate permease
VVILDLSDVTMLDMTAIVALESIVEEMQQRGILLIVSGLHGRILLKLRRTRVRKRIGVVEFARSVEHAAGMALRHLGAVTVSGPPMEMN